MAFWLTLICLVVSTILAFIASSEYWECIEVFSSLIAFFSGIALCIMLVIIIIDHSGTSATQAKMEEQYKAIAYKLESDACRDEFGLLNKEIIDEIQEWNEEIAFRKNVQNDVWIGVFYPDIYEEFELIALE